MSPVDRIKAWIARGRPLLLDGGLGGELEARGYDVSSSLWSASLILQQPEAIESVHRDFLDAGAQCITTSSYQASVDGLQALGMSLPEIEAVFRESVLLARRARATYLHENADVRFRPLIAASIGPYGAYLADGSEYRGNYGVDDETLRRFHAQRLHWLDRSGADLIACETMPDLQELRVLRRLLQSVSTPAWVSFCCHDAAHLHDGSELEQAIALFADCESVFALGFNCCPSALIEPLIGKLVASNSNKLITVYPNSGQQYDAEGKHWYGEGALEQWSQQAASWFAAGAGIIGGCCHVGPEYIRELATRETWRC